jgi:glycosyltransferase involved in cell wall biosynthesis
MVNIGFIPESLGGTEFYTYNLSRSLLQRGYEVTVLAAVEEMSSKRYSVTRTKLEGIEVIKIVNSPLFARSFNEHFQDPIIDDLFVKIVQEKKPDLIHFQHVAYLSGNMFEIAYQMGIPSILTLHDYWYICFRSRLLRPNFGICPGPSEGSHCATCYADSVPNPLAISRSPLLMRLIGHTTMKSLIANVMENVPEPIVSQARGLIFKDPEKNNTGNKNAASLIEKHSYRFDFFKKQLQYPRFILSPSEYLKRRYEELGFREIFTLPLGYFQTNLERENPSSSLNGGKLNIVLIGNIERHKGVLVALKEILSLQKSDSVRINIYGRVKDPIYFSEIQKFIRQYPDENIKFHGEFRSDRDLKEIFSQNHIMMFPSTWEENAPLVVREALLHDTPVIGSKLGGVPEIINDGENGLLFDPFVEGDLAQRVNHILEKPHILERIINGAKNSKIETMEDHVVKLEAFYHRALQEN